LRCTVGFAYMGFAYMGYSRIWYKTFGPFRITYVLYITKFAYMGFVYMGYSPIWYKLFGPLSVPYRRILLYVKNRAHNFIVNFFSLREE